jgi:hypothetical protein
MMNIPATSPGSTPSWLCLGNKVIQTTEQFSTLRVWCPKHQVILANHILVRLEEYYNLKKKKKMTDFLNNPRFTSAE